MERKALTFKDDEVSMMFDFVFKNAMGNPIIFNQEPTAADMRSNSWGVYSTNLYIKFANGTALKLTGSAI
jgi:hypothetical protein